MSQLITVVLGIWTIALLIAQAVLERRLRQLERLATRNPNPAPPGPPPVSQIKPPPPPAPPPPRPALAMAGTAPLSPVRLPRRCAACGAPATHLTALELAGVADPGKARITIVRPICPIHAAELAGLTVLELVAPWSWAELDRYYRAQGWGVLDAAASRLYALPIDESELAERFLPGAAKGGR